jgi:NADH-quinone oxidoreductase subunit N
VEGSLYYLFVYTFMVIGSFAVVTVVGGRGDTHHDLERYRGLAARQPFLAGSLALLLMAQAGIPFTTGFLAKLEVVSASVGARSTPLAVIAMVSAAVAAFFYLRVILLMYASGTGSGTYGADGPDEAATSAGPGSGAGADAGIGVTPAVLPSAAGAVTLSTPVATSAMSAASDGEELVVAPTAAAAIAVCVAVTVVFGVWPAPIVNFAHQATLLFG